MTDKTLNTIVRRFGFDTEEFVNVLYRTGAYVAGGACLYGFLDKQMEETSDLDIWLPTPITSPTEDSKAIDYRYPVASRFYDFKHIAQDLFELYLSKNGYILDRTWTAKDDIVYRNIATDQQFSKVVCRIQTYTRLGKKVQIISCYDISPQDNLAGFDLNICKFYCDPRTNGRTLKIKTVLSDAEVEAAKKGVGRVTVQVISPNTSKRIEKYTRRGFTFI